MRKKTIINKAISLFLIINILNPLNLITYANNNNNYTVIEESEKKNADNLIITKTYTTNDPNVDISDIFESNITRNKVLYEIDENKQIQTETIKTDEGKKEEYKYTSPVANKEDEVEKVKDKIEYNGKQYSLIKSEIKTNDINKKHESKEVEIKDLEEGETYPNEITTEINGNKYKLPFSKIISENEKWSNSFEFPIQIANYDADYFVLNGIKISKNENLINYKNEFLTYLNLSKDFYEITEIGYKGEAYNKNGILYRDAYAKGNKKVKEYKILYEGDVELKDAKEYYRESTYLADSSDTKTQYTIKSSVTYKIVKDKETSNLSNIKEKKKGFNLATYISNLLRFIKKHPISVTISVGILIIAGFILFLLLFLKKKKEEEKEDKIKIIDLENK